MQKLPIVRRLAFPPKQGLFYRVPYFTEAEQSFTLEHFWSDIPDDWWSASSRGDAEKHADSEHGTTTQIDSIEKLKSVFWAMLNFNPTLDQIDFQTHGGPGEI